MINLSMKIGNLVKDPEFLPEVGANKTPLCKFTIAVDRPYGADGVDYFDIVVWGKQAQSCADYLAKGRKVCVVGRDQHRTYDKKDGSGKGFAHEIIADQVEFLDSGKGGGQKQGSQPTGAEDDVPF